MSPRRYRSEARQLEAAETRARILETARNLLSTNGALNFTIDAVADQANVARMTVYNQFGSKRGLVEALSDDLAARGGIARLQSAVLAPDPVTGLRTLIEIFVGFWHSEHAVLRPLRAVLTLDPELANANRDVLRRNAISSLVERCRPQAGRAMARHTDTAVDLIWVLTGFESYELLASRGLTTAQIARHIIAAAEHVLGSGRAS